MKSLAYTTAIVSTVVAFVLTCVLTVHVRDVSLVPTVVEQDRRMHSQGLVSQEKVRVVYDFGLAEVSKSSRASFFPEIEDSVQPYEKAITNAPHCPFVLDAYGVVVDFTHNGTVPLEDLYLYADKDIEDAENSVELGVDVGTYVVELASYNSEEAEEDNYEQQWHLEFRDDEGNIVYTTQSTRDMHVGETGTIERVEGKMVLNTALSQARAIHVAYPDTKPQTIAPLCARLSIQNARSEKTDSVATLQGDEKNLFSASVFLQRRDTMLDSHFLFTLGVMLMLLCTIGVFLGYSISHRK